jgi:hypothetical protein
MKTIGQWYDLTQTVWPFSGNAQGIRLAMNSSHKQIIDSKNALSRLN